MYDCVRYRPWRWILLSVVVTASCRDTATNPPVDDELSWLQAHAVPFTNTDVATPEVAFSALGDAVGDARLVGMGEATHGTRDFWTMRQKMTSYLVQEKGFAAILHEAPFANSFPINDYVTRGVGSALAAHQALGYWRYQEMLDLINWMREYNLHRPSQAPLLHYFGYDCGSANWSGHTNVIVSYLKRVDPNSVADISARLSNYDLADAQYIVDFLSARAAQYTALSSAEECQLVLRVARMLEPSWRVVQAHRDGTPDGDIRESCAVDNVKWIIEHLLGGGKAVIWAHNAHIWNSTLLDNTGTSTMSLGARLKHEYGSGYFTLGAEFYGGSFYAWDECGSTFTDFSVHYAALPPDPTYAYHLHKAGIPLFFLDLGAIDYSDPAAAWLRGPLGLRAIGATYCAARDTDYYYSASLPSHYDGLVFYENTSPVTPISY